MLQSSYHARYVNFEELFSYGFVILFDQYRWPDKMLRLEFAPECELFSVYEYISYFWIMYIKKYLQCFSAITCLFYWTSNVGRKK